MRFSDIEPGQRFTRLTDPHDAEHTLTKLAGDGRNAVNGRFEVVPVHPDSSCELVEGGTESRTIPFTIEHHESEVTLSGRIQIRSIGIDVFFDGFGTHDSNPGFGSPLYIEPDKEGNPTIVCWSEIDSEDFTHKVSLRHSKDNREPTAA